MCKLQSRNTSRTKRQWNLTSPKADKASITKYKDAEMVEMTGKEFKNLILQMINDLKEDSKK
jgi:hypothetical protein